jgi:hypothetical protein
MFSFNYQNPNESFRHSTSHLLVSSFILSYYFAQLNIHIDFIFGLYDPYGLMALQIATCNIVYFSKHMSTI